jgi:hypothetical protein
MSLRNEVGEGDSSITFRETFHCKARLLRLTSSFYYILQCLSLLFLDLRVNHLFKPVEHKAYSTLKKTLNESRCQVPRVSNAPGQNQKSWQPWIVLHLKSVRSQIYGCQMGRCMVSLVREDDVDSRTRMKQQPGEEYFLTINCALLMDLSGYID